MQSSTSSEEICVAEGRAAHVEINAAEKVRSTAPACSGRRAAAAARRR